MILVFFNVKKLLFTLDIIEIDIIEEYFNPSLLNV